MSDRARVTTLAVAAVFILTVGAAALAAALVPRRVLEVAEPDLCLAAAYDVSAVVAMKDLLVFGVDEGTALQLLEEEDGIYRPKGRIELGSGAAGEPELDVEGLARAGDFLYVVGSHSAKRDRVKDDKSRKKNRKRMRTVEAQPSRDRLIRLRLDAETGAEDGERRELSLRQLLLADDYLRPFAGIPSKDNGIDIEGLAAADGKLYLGFRGPVLRGGHVPVMVLDDDWPRPDPDLAPGEATVPASWELRFVLLDGRGIRSLAAVDDGFLIVAGPVGDSDLSYRLYFWDGEDCIASDKPEDPPCVVADLGTLPTWAGAKAEGLAVLDESDAGYEILVVYDSAPLGLPTVFAAAKPAG